MSNKYKTPFKKRLNYYGSMFKEMNYNLIETLVFRVNNAKTKTLRAIAIFVFIYSIITNVPSAYFAYK
jgi:hypothetical protein